MREMTLREFLEKTEYPEFDAATTDLGLQGAIEWMVKNPQPNYEIYVVKGAQGEVLYVGISAEIYERWFGYRGRLQRDNYGHWMYSDHVSEKIVAGMPESWEWKIVFYETDECRKMFPDSRIVDRRDAERLLIHHMRPELNYMHNRA